MERTCLNGRRLIISDQSNFRADLAAAIAIPRVTLLSAWRAEHASLMIWEDAVEELLENGCTYFVCAGDFAEELHDLVDDIVFREPRDVVVATTFHNGEIPDDVINFFVWDFTIMECRGDHDIP